MLAIPSLILGLYAAISLAARLPFKVPFKLLAALFIQACAAKYQVYGHFGTWLNPNLPPMFLILLEGLHGAVLIAAVLCIINDLIFLAALATGKVCKQKIRLPHKGSSLAIFLFAWIMGLYGSFSQTLLPNVKEVEVTLDKLDPAFDGFKIVQLTDLHAGPINKGDWLSKVVQRTKELDADLIVLTGDLVDGKVNEMASEFVSFEDLKARYGVLAVTGNHEYYSGATSWISYWETLGVRFLQNEHVDLKKDGAVLTIGGINDRRGPKSSAKDAMAGTGDNAKILLSHEPYDGVKDLKADLTLAGHTHGGTMLFAQPIIAHYNGGFVSGLYDYEGSKVYVSNGTGIWSGFSCRFLVPPEITLITLKSKQ